MPCFTIQPCHSSADADKTGFLVTDGAQPDTSNSLGEGVATGD